MALKMPGDILISCRIADAQVMQDLLYEKTLLPK